MPGPTQCSYLQPSPTALVALIVAGVDEELEARQCRELSALAMCFRKKINILTFCLAATIGKAFQLSACYLGSCFSLLTTALHH